MSIESGHHEVAVYGARSTFSTPRQFLRDLWRDIMASRKLAAMLAFRDLKAQYRQSILGPLWLVIPPLAWTVGLTVLKDNNLANIGDFSENPAKNPAYILISMALWQMFTESLRGPMQALQMNRGILTKVRFPREAVIVADILKLLVAVAIQVSMIAVVAVVYRLPVTATVLAFPLAVGALILLGTTAGLLLAPIGLLYKDIGNSMQYIFLAGMAVTPVLFEMSELAPGGYYAAFVKINPVAPLLVTARELATGQVLTMLPQFGIVVGLTVAMLFVALALVRASMPIVIERWSA